MNKNYYVTTTIPYVNASPHLGFALEAVRADCLARFHKLLGEDVFYNTGCDEHGIKIYRKAIESGKTPQEYVDEYAAKFADLKEALNLSYDNFIRTTDPKHEAAAQEFWRLCDEAGYIYKKNYQIKYCSGCEMEKTDSELIEGKCEFHLTLDLDLIDEENYFFKFSGFEKKLLKFYKENPKFVVPKNRLVEITTFVKSGLEDFSISRLKEKMPWGVPVPNDDKQVMYVWFDALVNYISTLGWPEDKDKFQKYWGTKNSPQAIQLAGKDNLRQQSCMWQAMLMAVDLPQTKQVFIGDFIMSGGQRMSKSTGNVIDPFEYVEKYGTDALRYFLFAKINPFNDSDFTKEKFEGTYNADLANGLGNLVSRVAKMCQNSKFNFESKETKLYPKVIKSLEEFKFDNALKFIWDKVTLVDQAINKAEPWKLEGKKLQAELQNYLNEIAEIALNLKSFLPETTNKIARVFGSVKIKMAEPLFPRLK